MVAKFVEKHQKQVHRFFEIFLGLMTWGLLTSPVWLGIIYPEAIVYMLTFFTVYWSYMGLKHTLGLFFGYFRYRKERQNEWWEECKKLDFSELPDKETLPQDLSQLFHFVLIPAVNEPRAVFEDSLGAVCSQSFPLNQIVLVFTLEEKFAEETAERIKSVLGQKMNDFHKVLFYIHPRGISGEAIGDGGANRAWGTRHAVEDLRRMGENLRNYIFNNMDSDHVLHKEYLSRVAHLYLNSDKRDNHFYSSAVPLFENNLWRVPMMMRIEAAAVTLGVVSDWGASKSSMKKTFSAFSTSLQTLIDADYFNVSLGADDTIFYWRAFFARDGDFEGKPHFVPYSADAVEGKTYLESHKSLYKQLLRWGWGAIDFPLSITEFLKNKKIPRMKKIQWFFRHIKDRVFLVNVVFLITFGFGIVTLVNPLVKQSNFAYSLPRIMSIILTMTLIFLLPGAYYRKKFMSSPPKEWSVWKKILVWFEGPLIMLNLLTYSFVPWVHAQTKILLGQRIKDLYHTPKMR